MRKKSPTLAFLLSFLLPGAGLLYLGRWKWAFLNLGLVLLVGLVASLLLSDATIDQHGHLIAAGCGGGSGAFAQNLARQLNLRSAAKDAA